MPSEEKEEVMPNCPRCGDNFRVEISVYPEKGSHYCLCNPNYGERWFTPGEKKAVWPNCPNCGSNKEVEPSKFPDKGAYYCECSQATYGHWFTPFPQQPSQASHTFSSGATRSAKKPDYTLIEPSFLSGIAGVLEDGLKKYGRNNWVKGGKDFAQDSINHCIEHLFKFANGDRSEEHLLHAACGLMFLNYFNQKNPEYFEVVK